MCFQICRPVYYKANEVFKALTVRKLCGVSVLYGANNVFVYFINNELYICKKCVQLRILIFIVHKICSEVNLPMY